MTSRKKVHTHKSFKANTLLSLYFWVDMMPMAHHFEYTFVEFRERHFCHINETDFSSILY